MKRVDPNLSPAAYLNAIGQQYINFKFSLWKVGVPCLYLFLYLNPVPIYMDKLAVAYML